VLAAFLHMFGLLPSGNESLLRYTYRLFKAARNRLRGRDDSIQKFWELTTDYRETFAREIPGRLDRRFPVRFKGVWDTVSSVGWAWDAMHHPFTKTNPCIKTIRHAVSIGERRWFFRQNLFGAAGGQDIEELWFPGVHCDVGGGYPVDQGGLWQEPFRWMLEESKIAGLELDPQRESTVWRLGKVVPDPWREPQHESLTWKWWLAEVFPKMQYWPKFKMAFPAVGLGRRRFIDSTARAHGSAQRRLRYAPLKYRPSNVPQTWK
jgi:uncharacterized protein (DUF2235 family)